MVINNRIKELSNTFIALFFGVIGGIVFSLLNLPLAWMLGAMAATSIVAATRIKIEVTPYLQKTMISVVGVFLGCAFSPSIYMEILNWTMSLVILAGFLITVTLVVCMILRHLGYDWATAFFSALPAGLTEMSLVGAEYGGNQKIIVLNHTVRVMVVAFIIPFSIFYFQDIDRTTLAISTSTPSQPVDYLILLFCAVVGMWLGIKLKIPAGPLAVPLILSALVHVYGYTSAIPPDNLIIIAQIVLGSAVGARLSGVTITNLRQTCVIAFAISIGVLTFSTIIAWLLAPFLHVQPITLLLALAPGGVTEMSLIALATNQDIAFITTHHVVRISLLIIIGPLTYTGLKNILKTIKQ